MKTPTEGTEGANAAQPAVTRTSAFLRMAVWAGYAIGVCSGVSVLALSLLGGPGMLLEMLANVLYGSLSSWAIWGLGNLVARLHRGQ
jgi:hypothetical protein